MWQGVRRCLITLVAVSFIWSGVHAKDMIRLSQAEKPFSNVAPYLILSCMDFRFHSTIHNLGELLNIKDQYDQLILPGASLGATIDNYPAWRDTFFSSLKIAKNLHHVQQVYLLDHEDCGMYKHVYGKQYEDPKQLAQLHRKHLHQLKEDIQQCFPELKVSLMLMHLDNKVEIIEK